MISKALRSSRAWSLGKIYDFKEILTPDKRRLLIFVKLIDDFFDILVFSEDNCYFCRYKFPRISWYLEDCQEYLTNNF